MEMGVQCTLLLLISSHMLIFLKIICIYSYRPILPYMGLHVGMGTTDHVFIKYLHFYSQTSNSPNYACLTIRMSYLVELRPDYSQFTTEINSIFVLHRL